MSKKLNRVAHRTVILSALALCSLCACSSPLAEARGAWNEARYADAAVALETAAQGGMLAEAEECQLALYSGLTHLALGDLRRSIPQLTAAREHLEAAPECFSLAERGELLSAWRAIGRLPGQPLVSRR